MQPFATRNNVTYAAGTVTLAGATASSACLAPSAALISSNAYDGDIQINVTISDWQILQYVALANSFENALPSMNCKSAAHQSAGAQLCYVLCVI